MGVLKSLGEGISQAWRAATGSLSNKFHASFDNMGDKTEFQGLKLRLEKMMISFAMALKKTMVKDAKVEGKEAINDAKKDANVARSNLARQGKPQTSENIAKETQAVGEKRVAKENKVADKIQSAAGKAKATENVNKKFGMQTQSVGKALTK